MNVIDLMNHHVSVRDFKDEPLPKETKQKLTTLRCITVVRPISTFAESNEAVIRLAAIPVKQEAAIISITASILNVFFNDIIFSYYIFR